MHVCVCKSLDELKLLRIKKKANHLKCLALQPSSIY